MNQEDLCYTSALDLSRLLEAGELSPLELLDAVLERIHALNPSLNAFCTLTENQARADAQAATKALARGERLSPLHGIPVSIKDLILTQGVPTMRGSHIFANDVPDFDAPLVTRLKEAGAVILGKTTSSEFGWKGLSDCPLTGATHNPWAHGMTAGGSSAGAASAVAAGLGPLGQGTDGAGSIRIPAAFCGIYGLKPTFGRVPIHPFSNGDYTTHAGPMTRTVTDAALMLQVMAGAHELDHTSLTDAPEDYAARLAEGVRGLRIAYSPDLGRLRVDEDVAQRVAQAAQAFEGLGCDVEQVTPQWPDPTDMSRGMWNSHFAGQYAQFLPEWEDRLDPGLVASIRDGMKYGLVEYIQLRGRKYQYIEAVVRFFQDYDLLLTPSLSVPAFPVGQLNPDHWPQHEWDWMDWASFSYPFNFSGNPAATVPAGFTAAGLPVGLQIVGRRGEDLTVLQASAAFEQAHPWAQHRPRL